MANRRCARGAGSIAGPEAAEPDAVVRVVVDGLEIERGPELALGIREACRPVIGARERLAHRPLGGLEQAGALQRDHRGVHVAVGEQPGALLIGDVSVVARRSRHVLQIARPSEIGSLLWYNRSAFPNPEHPLPDFFAFAGLRYDCNAAGADLEALAAPPYDVIDEDQRAALEATAAHNAVRLAPPPRRARRTAIVTTGRPPRSRRGARWRAGRAIRRRASTRTGWSSGICGAMRATPAASSARSALPEPGDTSVLPHERTMPKAKSDRLALLRATRANVDPIWGLSLAEGLTGRLEPDTPSAPASTPTACVHELGAIDDPGPHRRDPARRSAARASCSPTATTGSRPRATTATSCARRAQPVGGAGAIMMLVVELVDDELDIEPIHRLIDLPRRRRTSATGLPTRSTSSTSARTRPTPSPRMQTRMLAERGLGVVDRDGFAIAIPQPEARAAALAGEHPAVAATDAASWKRWSSRVSPKRPGGTGTTRGAVAALVDKGAASVAILCSPVSVAQTRAAAVDRRAHAAEDDVLHPEAPLRNGLPQVLTANCDAQFDGPGRGGPEQRREVARAAALGGGDELALHLDLVRRPVDGAEHADRRRRLGVLGQARERERQRRVVAVLVVHEEPVLADVGDPHDLRFAELVHHHAHLAARRRSGSARRACRSMSMSGRASLLRIASNAPSLKTLQFWYTSTNDGAAVLVRTAEHLDHVLAVHVVGAGDERRLGAERDRDRVERVVERAERRRLRDLADLARR